MLKAFDISNHQKGIDAGALPADIVIVKATEGLHFVDKYCDGFYQAAKRAGKLLGHYHFARNNDPRKEARFFWQNTKNYSRESVPILDIEDSSIPSWGNYACAFADEYSKLSGGVQPMIYASAGQLARFGARGALQEACALWVAGYPAKYTGWLSSAQVPYPIAPWTLCTGWQFTSSFEYQGIKLDASFFYLDRDGWLKIAGAHPASASEPEPEPLPSARPSDELVPVYRLYKDGSHVWTADDKEASILAGQGWKNEGVAFYVYKAV